MKLETLGEIKIREEKADIECTIKFGQFKEK